MSLLVLVGIAGATVTLPVAAVGVFLAVAKWKKHASKRIVKDPPDPEFAQPVQEQRPFFRPAAFGGDEGGPLGHAASHVIASASLTEALVTAVKRADAAEAAGDANSAQRRTAEAARFAEQASRLLVNTPAALEAGRASADLGVVIHDWMSRSNLDVSR